MKTLINIKKRSINKQSLVSKQVSKKKKSSLFEELDASKKKDVEMSESSASSLLSSDSDDNVVPNKLLKQSKEINKTLELKYSEIKSKYNKSKTEKEVLKSKVQSIREENSQLKRTNEELIKKCEEFQNLNLRLQKEILDKIKIKTSLDQHIMHVSQNTYFSEDNSQLRSFTPTKNFINNSPTITIGLNDDWPRQQNDEEQINDTPSTFFKVNNLFSCF